MKYTYFYKARLLNKHGLPMADIDGFWEAEFKINSEERGFTVRQDIEDHVRSLNKDLNAGRFILDCLTYLG